MTKSDNYTHSIPVTLNELLVKLNIISVIRTDIKLNCKSLQFVNINSWIGSLGRYIAGENRMDLMNFLNQIIQRAIKAIDDYPDFKSIIVNHLYISKNGLTNLESTYKSDPYIVAQLKVLISNIDLQLYNYTDLIDHDTNDG
jgi:hypothetical protein